jgi:hypothetical protein
MRQTVEEKNMPAPDDLILKILISNTKNGDTDPFAATAELADHYRFHTEWIDRLKCAAGDIENYKKRNCFKDFSPTLNQADFYSIVVLGEGKERLWSFRGFMTKEKIIKRIRLVGKKDQEHHEAAEAEIAYWKSQI